MEAFYMNMSGYKVTDKDGYSVGRKLRKNPPDAGVLFYSVGEIIKPDPGMGPLAVFERKEDAERFKNHFKCYGFRAFQIKFKKSNVKFLFDGGRKLYKSGSINGTVYADEVLMEKEI